MPARLRARILQHRQQHPGRQEFADRLLEGIARIERDFSGDERERLLDLARRTFERHVQGAERSDETREALARLRMDQLRLVRILDLLSEQPGKRTLH